MTYTLDMAENLEPRIADDGVQEVPLTKARALLTRLIEQAADDGTTSALTVRGRRRAYLLSPRDYGRLQINAETVKRLRAAADDPRVVAVLTEADPDLGYLLEQDAI